jgi:hypothetical protein
MKKKIEFKLSRDYLDSYLSEYNATILFEFPYNLGLLDCGLPEHNTNGNRRKLSYHKLKDAFDNVKLHNIGFLTFDELMKIRKTSEYKNAIDLILNSCFADKILFLLISRQLKEFKTRYKIPFDSVRVTLDTICKNINFNNMEEKSKTDSKVSVSVTGGTPQINIAVDNAQVSATQNVGIDEKRLAELVGNVRKTISPELTSDEIDVVNDNLNVIEEELKQIQPRKSFLKTALTTLQAIKGSAEFGAAVATLVQFAQIIFAK